MATLTTEECCIICAEPLDFSGIGPCGHKETCSRCVARWRFVLKDKTCMFCKQDCPAVLFTRYMGDYTARLSPDQFGDLKNRANKGELYHIPEIDGYFDDPRHFADIKGLCGYTHPTINERCKEAGKEAPTFASFNAMKKFIETNIKLNFCDICVTSRKVFLCEQVLYTKAELDRHHKQGDETGPMAESGFKGHPQCRFCRQRFYDSNELYRHMESAHEHCFLCRRQQPDKYVYYRHYKELEDHFRTDHYLCPHPACMEKKFVVFSGEHEMKRHFATEHGDEAKMSRAQRREAMSISLQLQYRSGEEGPGEFGSNDGLHHRPGVVIGGGYNVTARHGRGASASMRHSRSEGQMLSAAMNASAESAAVEASMRDAVGTDPSQLSSVTFSAEEFPTVSASNASSSSGAGAVGRWAGMAGASTPGGGRLSHEQFPALPTLSKGQKKRMKEREKSLADQLRAANMPVRVISRGAALGSAAGPSNSNSGAAAGTSSAAAGGSGSAAAPAAPPQSPLSKAAGSRPVSAAPAAAAAGPTTAVAALARAASMPLSSVPSSGSSSNLARLDEDFPSLASAPSGNGAVPPSPLSSAPGGSRYTSAALRGSSSGAAREAAAAAAAAEPAPVVLTGADFPSLGQLAVATAAAARSGPSAPTPSSSAPSSSARAKAAPVTASSAAAVQPGGVSESLKAANKALVDKIRSQLSSDAFQTFRAESSQFMKGGITPAAFHDRMVSLGLLGVASELAALCPDPDKRSQLMSAHRAYLASPAAQDPGRVGAGWVPPEAAIAAAHAAEQRPSWSCDRCTLINAPDAPSCEACLTPRHGGAGSSSSGGEGFPSLSSTYGSSAAGSRGASSSGAGGSGSAAMPGAGTGGAKKTKAGTKITIGLGAGTGRGAAPTTPAAPPPNAWGTSGSGSSNNTAALRQQVEAQRQAMAAQQAARGAWSKSGGSKLARQMGAVNDAWSKQ